MFGFSLEIIHGGIPPLMIQAYHFWPYDRGDVSKIFLYSSAVLKFLLSYSGIKVVV
ncbi:hypothetical protein LBSG162_05020 [Lentilactobacillus buchneri subsp. silagei]|nr:hypothetical protein LBSG162_05020 [Lentilactobacillus buchneri subsp. silagei]GED93770.1 hypothetical protein LBSP_03300 [Lentilactobacillus buchneri subsp. silagei]